jgi:pimeloyl-ACP methyl ester carboxylesterase
VTSYRRPVAVLTVTALLVSLQVLAAGAASQRVSFRTDDGLTLAGTWYEPSTRPAPAVIFIHMLQKSRRDWDQVAERMAAEGIGGLAMDLRGHGDSPGSPQDYAGMVQDIRAARRFLSARADVTPARIGIAGASIGASLAALAAADDPSVVSLALLSPSLDYRGLRLDAAVKKYGARPVLLVASDDDGYAVRSVRELRKAGAGVREVVVLSRAGHGTAMLANDADLGRRLLEWFRQTLL